jgi:OFA family oxalate/formate antiporter-like MFS transporter
MMAVSSPQYVWTLFVKPFQAATGASLPTVQITFSVLIVVQTLFSPAQGWLVDRFGPKALVAVGAALTGLGWILSAHVDNVWMLFLTYGLLCGVGTGIVYVGVIGLMARWFPDRRGFAIGIVAAGYGMGAMLTTFPISSMLASSGAPMTLIVFGVILGSVGVLAALGLHEPRAGEARAPAARRAQAEDVPPVKMLKTPIFWLMFVMMTMMSTGGLMVTSNFANFARDFGVADVLVLGLAALPFALTVDRLLNGFTRPFFWLAVRSDRPRKYNGARLWAGGGSDPAAASLQRRRAGVHRALGPRLLRLGGDLLSLPLDAHRHVREPLRHDKLRFPLHRPRRRFDPRGSGCGFDEGRGGKLDACVRRRGGNGHRHHPACALRAEADARRLSWP